MKKFNHEPEIGIKLHGMPAMTRSVIIVAGGSGSRMGSATPKQFIPLAGKPVLMHTVSRFYQADSAIKIVVVLPENEIPLWRALCAEYLFDVSHEIVPGGKTRFHSVSSGLARIKDDGIVAVHDGVRPLVSAVLIRRCFEAAELKGNAVPAVPAGDSIRLITGASSNPVDRNTVMNIQTPQCFSVRLLKKAYQVDYNPAFTDDASVAEASGEKINLVEGDRENIKITFPADLAIAGALLEMQG